MLKDAVAAAATVPKDVYTADPVPSAPAPTVTAAVPVAASAPVPNAPVVASAAPTVDPLAGIEALLGPEIVADVLRDCEGGSCAVLCKQ